ncbi:MAG: hypothetical protein KU38_10255 [Sulfurovum sp. FS08-3]|nr:MAG: hypothetical protein KU38_10255 [Sulfurovum sp. FS08-3]
MRWIWIFILVTLMGEAKALRVLISGFETFGGLSHNPTELMIQQLQKEPLEIEGMSIQTVVLPVTYFQSWQRLKEEIDSYRPDVVLSFGYAPSSHGVRLERISQNYDRGGKDNAGVSHFGKIIEQDSNETLTSQLPLKELKNYLEERGFEVNMSDDAGGYICNHLFYYLMHHIQNKGIQGGFIHISDMPLAGQNGSMALLKEIVTFLSKRQSL